MKELMRDEGTVGGTTADVTPPVTPPMPNITAAGFVSFLEEFDANVPKIESFVKSLEKSPLLVGVVELKYPQVKVFLAQIDEVLPWIDFLDEFDKAILAAINTSSTS